MIQLNAITLPAGLQWVDEFNWQSVMQSTQRTLAGGLVLQERGLSAGRPITLSGGSNHGWISRSVLDSLYALASVAGQTHTLSIRGATYPVRFYHEDGNAIEAEPLFPMADPQAGDYYISTIKLITV